MALLANAKPVYKSLSQNEITKRKLVYIFGPKEYRTAAQIEAKVQIINC